MGISAYRTLAWRPTCTGPHDTNYYEQQRQALLKKHGIDLEYPVSGGTAKRKMRRQDVERIMVKEWLVEGKESSPEGQKQEEARILCLRQVMPSAAALGALTDSTNSYMAPEGFAVRLWIQLHWWSLGVISKCRL